MHILRKRTHTIFKCNEWHQQRTTGEDVVKVKISVDNNIRVMLEDRVKWKTIEKIVRQILRKKESDERKNEKEDRTNDR